MTDGGSISGRQMRSPLPVHSASPSLSWISGRQSGEQGCSFSPYQYMLVIGAMPNCAISLRDEKLGLHLHDHAGTALLASNLIGAGEARPIEQGVNDDRRKLATPARANQNSTKRGNSSLVDSAVSTAMPRAEPPY